MRYVVLVDYTDMEARNRVLDRHRAFLNEARAKGIVTEAGPFADGKGGMYILKAASEGEAREFIAKDPYQEAKLGFTIRAWQSSAEPT